MKIIDSATDLYKNDIKPMYQQCLKDLNQTQGLYLKAVKVLKTTDSALRKIIIHYPKTMLIATFANAIFTFVFPSMFTIMGLVIHDYLILIRHISEINTVIKVYEENNISEWFSSYKDKEFCSLGIAARLLMAVDVLLATQL